MKEDTKKEEIKEDQTARGVTTSEDEIDLLELFGVIWKRRKLIVALVFGTTLLTGLISLMIPPSYKATAKIIPIGPRRDVVIPYIPTDLLGAIGGIKGLDGSANIIKAVLESRELAKLVIQKLDLRKYIYPDVWDERTGQLKVSGKRVPEDDEIAEKFLREFLQVTDKPKVGVIEISVVFPKHATLAAIVANTIVESLQTVLNQKAYTVAKKNRLFIEEQARIAKANLERSEEEFRRFQERFNVVSIDKQMEESIKLYAELVGILSEKEVRLRVMKRMTTPDNPEVIALEYEIGEIRKKLKELEEGQKRATIRGYILDTTKKVIIPLENVPDITLEYIRKRRDLEIQNEIYKVILTALEKAKIDEAKEDISFQLIDSAYTPRHKFKPKRKIMLAASFVSSALFGFFLAFVLEAIEKRRKSSKPGTTNG